MVDPNTFGAPRTGVHAYRIFDTAIVDLVATMFLAHFIRLGSTYAYSLLAWLVVGEIMHYVVGVQTAWMQHIAGGV